MRERVRSRPYQYASPFYPRLMPIACRKGFREAQAKGAQIGHPVQGVRVVLTDGQTHVVDSNEMAFKLAANNAFRTAFLEAKPNILEPIMKVCERPLSPC